MFQQADKDFVSIAKKFNCVKVNISNWGDPIATQYGINSIPKIVIIDQKSGGIIKEIPWANDQGDLGKLKQILNSALEL